MSEQLIRSALDAFGVNLAKLDEDERDILTPVLRRYREAVDRLLSIKADVDLIHSTPDDLAPHRSALMATFGNLSRRLSTHQYPLAELGPAGNTFVSDLGAWFQGTVVPEIVGAIGPKLGLEAPEFQYGQQSPPNVNAIMIIRHVNPTNESEDTDQLGQ